MLNILVVEDNASLRNLMCVYLKRAGYNALEAENGQQALDIMDVKHVHLLIVDVMMPVMDGYELTAALREADYDQPILMATAKEAFEDKRTGFKHGADDYMVKPIDMEELLLRVEALLRRANITDRNILKIGDCILDETSLTVSYQGISIILRQKEFRLLHKLVTYPGKIFTRQMLMDEIWGYDSETNQRSVDVHVKRVREKLSMIPTIDLITVRGLGYKAVIHE
ncbi:MAG: response regulator transcription factor [Clostridia bacterium]|nr:response regulator transcription factor [Clostridia bacterium]